jgi:exonuclease III
LVASDLVVMDHDKILIWNVRGLNSSARQDSVHTLVASSQIDIVCLQETKFAAVSRWVMLAMLGSDFSSFVEFPSNGASGGILVAWRNSVGSTGETRVDEHSFSVQFRLQDGQTWWLICVYGPQGSEENPFLARIEGHKINSSWTMDHSRGLQPYL